MIYFFYFWIKIYLLLLFWLPFRISYESKFKLSIYCLKVLVNLSRVKLYFYLVKIHINRKITLTLILKNSYWLHFSANKFNLAWNQCPIGYISPGDTLNCTPCPAGKVTLEFAAILVDFETNLEQFNRTNIWLNKNSMNWLSSWKI